ncbi:hypothetical protein ACRAWF_07985 [Streptomyces sp. L7]
MTRSSPTYAALADRAREEDVPVIWVQHSDENTRRARRAGSTSELTLRDQEPLIRKTYPDSFDEHQPGGGTGRRPVGRLVVAGASAARGASAPLDPQRVHALARDVDAGRRRHHDRPQQLGCAAGGAGHRPREPLYWKYRRQR